LRGGQFKLIQYSANRHVAEPKISRKLVDVSSEFSAR
jgi:hypothetical protein